MDDNGCAGILFGIILFYYVVVFAVAMAFGILLFFIFGIIVNMTIRWIANQYDWYKIDESNIWWLIIVLTITPILIAILFAAMAFSREPNLIWMFGYPIWLAGYLVAVYRPDLKIGNYHINFEIGLADVIMVSTLNEYRTTLEMRWQLVKFHYQMLIESFRSLP